VCSSDLEMARGYGTFMIGGNKLYSHAIIQLSDTQGNTLYDFRKDQPEPKRVLKVETVTTMNRMLAQIPEWGTARRAKLDGIRAGGKTGTTQAYRDAWFVGFTGNYVAAVWFGNDNYKPTKRLTGGRLPAMTWKKFMTYAHQNIELKPVPYIDDPLPGIDPKQIAKAKNKDDGAQPVALRPKTLSSNAETMLRDLEKILKNARPLDANQRVVSQSNPVQTTQ